MKKLTAVLVAVAAGATLLASAGCSSGPANNNSNNNGTDAGSTDAGPDCYQNPTTYYEIINACTNAVAIDKTPVLPLLQADGGLPPLPN